jgi:hypothetical protein
VGLPENQCGTRPGTQNLFSGPQCISCLFSAQHPHMFGGQTPPRQRGRLHAMRRLQKNHRSPRDCGECGPKKANFTASRLLDEEIR